MQLGRVTGTVRSLLAQGLNVSTVPRIAALFPGAEQEQFLRHLHHSLTLRQSIDAEFRQRPQTPPIPSTTAGS